MANAHIVNFIQSLSDEEIKSAKDYIYKVLSACKANSTESKQLLLFNYITANRDKTISEATLSKITGTKNISSLKFHLYETLTEAITLNKHISNKATILNKRDQVVLRLKKKLLIVLILFRTKNQKRFGTIQYLFNEIVKEAKEHELYNLLYEVLSLKKYTVGIRAGIKEFNKINEEICFYDYCQKAVYYASDCYYQLISNDNLAKSLSEKELDHFFDTVITQMEIDYKKTRSQEVAYYLHIIRFALCERQKNYRQGILYCNELISITKKSKVLYRKERIGLALNNLSLFKNYIGNYESAAIDTQKAQEYFIKNSFDYIVSIEQVFYAYIYNNNAKKALRCTRQLLKHSLADLGKFRRSKYVYYHSCALFISKNYTEALNNLKTPLEIEKDKAKWSVHLRIFKIMLFIELNKIDEAARSLESLRKYMERTTKKDDEVKPRDILIVKLLRKMEKDGFNYNPKNPNVAKMLNELSKKDTPLSWEHYTAELVPFHKWLGNK